MAQDMPPQRSRPLGRTLYSWALTAAALVAVAVIAVLATTSRVWIDRPFPGFFVFDNRVIPSIGLPHWTGSQAGMLYQQTVVSVDGEPVADGTAIYRHVDARPPGTSITYELRRGAATHTVPVTSSLFSSSDYRAIFGAYLGTSVCYLALAVLGLWLAPAEPLGRALLFVGGVGGLYGLSAVGIYGPIFAQGIHHLHVLAEAFFPAALLYLAVVFPRPRAPFTTSVITATWGLSGALAIPYLLVLEQPGAYSVLHAACEIYMGVAGAALASRLLMETTRAPADLLLRSVAFGTLVGLAVPGVVVLLSGLSGGRLPVNLLTATAFLFPLCCAHGLVRTRLARRSPRLSARPQPAA
jgi:hypothetical protein